MTFFGGIACQKRRINDVIFMAASVAHFRYIRRTNPLVEWIFERR
jgi:hypothetical protein